MTPGSPSDSPWIRRQPLCCSSIIPARAATARSTRCRKKASSMGIRTSNVQTRARICDDGEKAALASRVLSAAITPTVSPGPGSPSTTSIAPENTHGCRWRSDFSRPGLRRTSDKLAAAFLAKGYPSQLSDQERKTAGKRAKRQHSRARVQRVATGEEREQRPDGEQRDGGDTDRNGQGACAAGEDERRQRQHRTGRK